VQGSGYVGALTDHQSLVWRGPATQLCCLLVAISRPSPVCRIRRSSWSPDHMHHAPSPIPLPPPYQFAGFLGERNSSACAPYLNSTLTSGRAQPPLASEQAAGARDSTAAEGSRSSGEAAKFLMPPQEGSSSTWPNVTMGGEDACRWLSSLNTSGGGNASAPLGRLQQAGLVLPTFEQQLDAAVRQVRVCLTPRHCGSLPLHLEPAAV
jgi:hypothetical protein